MTRSSNLINSIIEHQSKSTCGYNLNHFISITFLTVLYFYIKLIISNNSISVSQIFTFIIQNRYTNILVSFLRFVLEMCHLLHNINITNKKANKTITNNLSNSNSNEYWYDWLCITDATESTRLPSSDKLAILLISLQEEFDSHVITNIYFKSTKR